MDLHCDCGTLCETDIVTFTEFVLLQLLAKYWVLYCCISVVIVQPRT